MLYFRDGAQTTEFKDFLAHFANKPSNRFIGRDRLSAVENRHQFEGLMQTLEAVACMHVLASLYPCSSSSCSFDGGGKHNESDGLFLLNELVNGRCFQLRSVCHPTVQLCSTWSYMLY